MATLDAVVISLDAVSENKASEAAKKETTTTGETVGEGASVQNDSGECKTEDDFQKEIARSKNLEGAK